jgi:hypothetical protein
MIICPHCGATNQPNERYCSACSLDLKKQTMPLEESSPISRRAVVIILAIVVAAGLLLWFIAAIGASGLSD